MMHESPRLQDFRIANTEEYAITLICSNSESSCIVDTAFNFFRSEPGLWAAPVSPFCREPMESTLTEKLKLLSSELNQINRELQADSALDLATLSDLRQAL